MCRKCDLFDVIENQETEIISQGDTWTAGHCLGNTTVSTLMAAAFTANKHKQIPEQALKYKPKWSEKHGTNERWME